MLHVFRDDITTSVTWSDTVVPGSNKSQLLTAVRKTVIGSKQFKLLIAGREVVTGFN